MSSVFASPHFIATVNAKTRRGVALSAACMRACVCWMMMPQKADKGDEGKKTCV